MKKLFSSAIVLLMAVSLMVPIKAADNMPVQDDNLLFLSGHDAVIKADPNNSNGAIVTSAGNEYKISGANSAVYAGFKDGDKPQVGTVNIVMESGFVDYIIGMNYASGNVDTANITINGGSVGMVQGSSRLLSNKTYADRKNNSITNFNVTMNDGNVKALMTTYSYTFVKNSTITVNGGNLAATTSPVQSGVLGGSNGEVENLTINFNGGKTKDIALTQRAMITGKAVVNVNGGSVDNIYAGSYYDDGDNAAGSNNWDKWTIGDVNYGQVANITINAGKDADYNNIYAGFQYLDKQAFINKYKNWISNIEGSEKAPLTLNLKSEAKNESRPLTAHTVKAATLAGDFVKVPAMNLTMDKPSLTMDLQDEATLKATVAPSVTTDKVVWSSSNPAIASVDQSGKVKALSSGDAVITATAGNVTATSNVNVKKVDVAVPEVPTDKPAGSVDVGITDDKIKDTLTDTISNITSDLLNGKTNTKISKETANKLLDAVNAGKQITAEPTIAKADMKEYKEESKKIDTFLNALEKQNNSSVNIAEYLDLGVMLKADGINLGALNVLDAPVSYSVKVSKDLIKKNREFYVVRIHDGKIEKLKTTFTNGTLSFETDKYSLYAIVYEDVTPGNSVNTGDSNYAARYIAYAILGLSVMALIVTIDKKQKLNRK